jgi:hypothetical protein
MLLYDGTTNPTALAPNSVALYQLSLPLPVTPFVITDFENPNITLEEWFIQPTGSTTSNSVSLQFNDGGLSHINTSINTISAVPTLTSVMAAGNSVGTTVLNMNNQNITNCATITAVTVTPTNITDWNVKQITAGTGVGVTNTSGNYTIASTIPTSGSTFFTEISLTPNTNLSFPTTMDLFKYDYEMDFTFIDLLNSKWIYLRFNNDVGLTAWASTLLFNPVGTTGNTTTGAYNNAVHGSSLIYWLYGGVLSGTTRMTLKATYRISAISAQQFVVYLMSSQPVPMPQADNANETSLIYATKIFYKYSTNDATRWCPSSFVFSCAAGEFTTGRCLIRQVIKSNSYL